ncbi:hypothetical protein LTS16_013068 [Friedmanniomyces endolithicus]|nr:hypothetical protein LTS16_013068 [Friedmanniomyces endolithicus]
MPITEVVLCPLVPGSDICGSHEAAGAALRDTVDGLHRCSGCQQFIAGMQLENVDMMEAFITWESLEKYHEFRKTPDHGVVVANLIKLRIKPLTPYHVEFRPFTAFMRATEAPVTEVATFYFDGSAPTGVLDRFTRFREVLNKQHVSGVLGDDPVTRAAIELALAKHTEIEWPAPETDQLISNLSFAAGRFYQRLLRGSQVVEH